MKALILSYFEPKGQGCGFLVPLFKVISPWSVYRMMGLRRGHVAYFSCLSLSLSLSHSAFAMFILQGQSTQIDAFQTNIFSLFDDIMIKKKIFLKSLDREIWYKTFNLGIHIVLWSQSLHIWKIQWVVLLIFRSHIQMKVKTKTM